MQFSIYKFLSTKDYKANANFVTQLYREINALGNDFLAIKFNLKLYSEPCMVSYQEQA